MPRLAAFATLVASTLALALTAGAARAAESAVPLTPSGGTDIGQALLPPPGLYGAVAILPFNLNQKLIQADGKAAPNNANVRFSMQTVAVALSYVYPVKVFGGSVASDISVPFTSQNSNIGFASTHNNTSQGDMYVGFFDWSRHLGAVPPGAPPTYPGFTVAFGLSMKMPTGPYSTQHVSIGNNVFVFVPNGALTWTGPGVFHQDGDTQLSTKIFYGVPTQNPADHYQSGNAMSVDFSATQSFGPLRAGFAGTFADQTTDDRLGDGVDPPGGKRFQQLQVGPVIAYAIPHTKLAVKFKYLRTIYVRNDIDDQFLVAALAMKF